MKYLWILDSLLIFISEKRTSYTFKFIFLNHPEGKTSFFDYAVR